MADAAFRFQQAPGPTGQYYTSHSQQNHQQRHLARNGSPINSGRGPYTNETPSPSRSPVSQAASYLPHNMYGQNHLPAHNVMIGGGSHSRYPNTNLGHKFQHQNQQQHHGPSGHHPGGNVSAVGHQHNFSSGNVANSTPQYTPNGLHNSGHNSDPIDMNGNFSHYAQEQMQYANESRQGAQHPHRHCKKPEAARLLSKAADENCDEQSSEDNKEERNRASITDIVRRQDWDALDVSGQGLKAIAKPIFSQFRFLRKLFLDHNQIRRLDPAIGRLRLLTHLDLSGNVMTEVPPELGMLVNLKILLLFDNRLTHLPDEIGHLYKLDVLGIAGNPWNPDYRSLMNTKGTKELITRLREEQLGGIPSFTPEEPPPREWLQFESLESSETLSILSYNILCDKYATASQYGYTPSESLIWEKRRNLILSEIVVQDIDVVCLQEVDRESFQDFFQYELAAKDYKGIFYPKSRAKTMAEKEAKLVDGCAIFYKAKSFICLDKMVVDFGSTAINRLDMKGEHDIFNRVMPRDNISVVAFLENRLTGSRFMVCNAHIYWHPSYADVKIVQVAILLEQIARRAEEWSLRPPCTDKMAFRHSEVDRTHDGIQVAAEPAPSMTYASGSQIPLIVCGDFNSVIGTGVCDLITKGDLAGNHEDLAGRSYGNFTRDGMHHPFKLKSAYGVMGELDFTNYTPEYTGVIDYIWFSSNAMDVKGLLGNVDEQYLRRVPGFPNAHFPSDHLALKAEFAIKPQSST